MIEIKEESEAVSTLISPNGEVVGKITGMLQLEQIRDDIRKERVDGYSIIFEDKEGDLHTMQINENGYLDKWPKGFYDAYNNFLDSALGLS